MARAEDTERWERARLRGAGRPARAPRVGEMRREATAESEEARRTAGIWGWGRVGGWCVCKEEQEVGVRMCVRGAGLREKGY
jgi:hypothetical protein